jgi:hypothetical protein
MWAQPPCLQKPRAHLTLGKLEDAPLHFMPSIWAAADSRLRK